MYSYSYTLHILTLPSNFKLGFFLVGTMQWMLPCAICSTNFSSTSAYIAPEEPWGIPAGWCSGALPSQIPWCHYTIRISVITTFLGLTSCRFPPYQGMYIPFVVLNFKMFMLQWKQFTIIVIVAIFRVLTITYLNDCMCVCSIGVRQVMCTTWACSG